MLLQDYIDTIKVEIANAHLLLGRGGAASYEEYRYQVGCIHAYNKALTLLQELYQSTPKEER